MSWISYQPVAEKKKRTGKKRRCFFFVRFLQLRDFLLGLLHLAYLELRLRR